LSFITISRENYFYNLSEIEKKVANKNQIAVVLKDNAYGHGLKEIATLSKEFGIEKAVVRNLREAKTISEFFSYILILAPSEIEERENFFYTINSIKDIERYSKTANIELKVDTGMHRLGVSPLQLKFALNQIRAKGLNLRGFFTHFRDADEVSTSLYTQRELFKNLKESVLEFFPDIHTHSNNSAGLFRTGEIVEDEIVRVGISSYGYLRGDKSLKFPKLKPVLSLFANKVGELKNSQSHFRVGYGGISEVGSGNRLSTYDIGYADGFRRLSDEVIKNEVFKTPNGSRVFGKVSMDSTIFNCRDETLEIFNNTEELAKIFGTIDYEVLVTLSERIERKII
jgi:alanine racemase